MSATLETASGYSAPIMWAFLSVVSGSACRSWRCVVIGDGPEQSKSDKCVCLNAHYPFAWLAANPSLLLAAG
jgi:hypothetical protein